MTVETFTPAAPYTVAGIGPYAIAHPYLEGSIRVFTTVGEVEVQLPPTDYSLSPLAATVAGNLFLTPAAAAAQAGRALRIRRVTAQEQGWVGVQGEREKGLERQLDRLTYAVQEGSALLDRTLRTRDPIAPFVPQPGRTLLFDGTAIVAGPNAMDIADAQENAAAALASQVAAAGSATAAAGSATAAAASAATVNLPSLAGKALQMLRVNAGATGYEHRTPAQVLGDQGLTVTAVQINEGIVPPGAIMMFARNTPPNGWLKANGAAVSRTTYAALFAAIGTTFGAGDGSTTFGLPDLRGEFVRGWDDGRGVDSARVFGSAQDDLLRNHTHNYQESSGSTQWTGAVGGSAARSLTAVATGNPNSSLGGVETRPRNIAVLACIKF